MAELVESLLQSVSEKELKYKSTEVIKDIDVDIDEGNLLVVDKDSISYKDIRTKKEIYLRELTRDNTQLLFNQIWQIPTERVEDAIIAELPKPRTILPREKTIPKAKVTTKWEEYAKTKGIKNKKKGRMLWDEELKEWRPRWGYKRANDEMRDWVIEVPDNADPNEDQFEKRKKAKKERIAKNELQRLRNIARNMKGKVPGVGLTPTDTPDKDLLSRALTAARKSTASVGKFAGELPKEKEKSAKIGRKRQFEPNYGDLEQEKKKSLDILARIQSRKPTIDVTKAANQQLYEEDNKRADENRNTPRKGKKRGGPKGDTDSKWKSKGSNKKTKRLKSGGGISKGRKKGRGGKK